MLEKIPFFTWNWPDIRTIRTIRIIRIFEWIVFYIRPPTIPIRIGNPTCKHEELFLYHRLTEEIQLPLWLEDRWRPHSFRYPSHCKVCTLTRDYSNSIQFDTYIHFRLAINSPDEFFDIGQEYIHIQPGTINVIRVKPSQLVSSDDVKSVNIAARKCRFEDEIPENMTMFQSYSRKACLYDCMFQYR